jgi:hypothetical protein
MGTDQDLVPWLVVDCRENGAEALLSVQLGGGGERGRGGVDVAIAEVNDERVVEGGAAGGVKVEVPQEAGAVHTADGHLARARDPSHLQLPE